MKSSASIIINKPIQEVFDFIADISKMEIWVDGVSQPERISEGDLRVGSTFKSNYTHGGETQTIHYEVTTLEAPHRFGIRSLSGSVPFDGQVELEAMNGKTKIINSINAGSDSFGTTVIFTLFRPIIRRAMSNQLLKELEILRRTIETA